MSKSYLKEKLKDKAIEIILKYTRYSYEMAKNDLLYIPNMKYAKLLRLVASKNDWYVYSGDTWTLKSAVLSNKPLYVNKVLGYTNCRWIGNEKWVCYNCIGHIVFINDDGAIEESCRGYGDHYLIFHKQFLKQLSNTCKIKVVVLPDNTEIK